MPGFDANAVDLMGRTPLHTAALAYSVASAEATLALLLSRGADPCRRDYVSGGNRGEGWGLGSRHGGWG